jgi:hypothetical protein
MVQVFLLKHSVPTEASSSNGQPELSGGDDPALIG